jgi:hypothetical protein
MIRLKEGESTPELDRDLWDFFRGNRKLSSADESNAWMQYEYARSSKLIVKAVEAIRRNSQPSAASTPHPAFAKTLARVFRNFLQFPGCKSPRRSLPRALRRSKNSSFQRRIPPSMIQSDFTSGRVNCEFS